MEALYEKHSSEIRVIPKLLAVLGYAGGLGLGLVPYAVQVRSPLLLLVEIAVVAAIAAIAAFSRREHASPGITVRELVLGLLGRISAGAVAGLLGFMMLFVFLVVSWVFGLGAGLSTPWVFWTSSVVLTMLTALLAYADADDIFTALYPQRTGQQSPFFAASIKQSAARTIRIAVLVVTAGLSVSALLSVAGQNDLAFFCDFALLVAGSEYLQANPPKAARQVSASAMEAVQRLLEAAGYRVVLRPLTGNEEADAVVSTIDFLALRSDGGMAGWVRTDATSDGIDGVASLESAVWVLQDRLQTSETVKVLLEPMLILMGAERGDLPETVRSVRIVHIPAERELTAMIDGAEGSELAVRLFGRLPTPTSKVA